MDNKEVVRKQAEGAFIRSRIYLLQHRPFYAHLVMRLRLEWLDENPCPTQTDRFLSATDGEALWLNPLEYTKLSKGQQITTLVHEVLHCAWGHLWRRSSRDMRKWNMAGDICIDNVMLADGFEAGPWEQSRAQWLSKHGLSVEQFNGHIAEAVYDKLPDPPQGKSCGCGGNGTGGCFKDQPGAGGSAKEQEWKQHVVAAGQLAGNQKGAWTELVKAAMPKPPFHLKLFDYLSRGLGGDTSWAVLNRRTVYRGMYLPTDMRLVMGRMAFVVDTSGSMSHEQLKLAFGYIRSFRDSHPCVADVICCDYGVASHKTYEEHEALPSEFEAKGRGGTSFNAPFELLREKRIEPRVLVYITDAYGSCTVPKPAYPVLWCVVKGDKEWRAPFGEVCQVN